MINQATRTATAVAVGLAMAGASLGAAPTTRLYRSGDGVKWERQDSSLVEPLTAVDLVAVGKPTPARAGPDAGTVLLYGIREIPAKEDFGVVRLSSGDLGRTFGAADVVTINGWPRDAQEFVPASLSAVQLADGRLRLYLSLRKRVAPPKDPDWRMPKPETPEPREPGTPSRPFGDAAEQPVQPLVERADRRWNVLSAISTDGLRFSIEEGVRFRVEGLSDPEIVELSDARPAADAKVGGPWLMFFSREGKVRLASSADGLTWKSEEWFTWSAVQPTAAADGGSSVRLWAQTGSGLVSAIFEPTSGELKPESVAVLKSKGTDPSVILPGDGSRLLVWNERAADNGVPGVPRPRVPRN